MIEDDILFLQGTSNSNSQRKTHSTLSVSQCSFNTDHSFSAVARKDAAAAAASRKQSSLSQASSSSGASSSGGARPKRGQPSPVVLNRHVRIPGSLGTSDVDLEDEVS